MARPEIAVRRVLEATQGYCEFEGGGIVGHHLQAVDQAGGEAVAGADAIDDARDVIRSAHQELLAVVQAGSPAVPGGALRFAQ